MQERSSSPVDPDRVRAWFPALSSDLIFLENAGGSQVPQVVADRIRAYMLEKYVQLDAGYALSQQATETVHAAHDLVNLLVNGTGLGKIVLASSCSVLCRMLADCYASVLEPGDEIIFAESGHEANVGPWVSLEQHGMLLKQWRLDRESIVCPLAGLEELLSDRTRIVALPHVSNLLGDIVDVEAVVELAHRHGARVVADGVAYAPHRAIDVAAWDVDWYVYSTYKVYGPHMAALYGKHEALAELTGPNHYFIPRDEVPYKFELGGPSHEGCAGLLALGDYLQFLAGRSAGDSLDRDTITDAFEVMTCLELPVQERLIRYLLEKPGVRLIGPSATDRSRVGTVSFVHESLTSREIAAAAHAHEIAIRHGHMYAHRLCKALDLDPDDGVVRVSPVHYNTTGEIDRLIDVFERVL